MSGEVTMTREITVGGGHASGQQTWLHFGLNTMTDADVVVTWPDGTKSAPMHVTANGFYVLRPNTDAAAWSPS